MRYCYWFKASCLASRKLSRRNQARPLALVINTEKGYFKLIVGQCVYKLFLRVFGYRQSNLYINSLVDVADIRVTTHQIGSDY